MRHVLPRIVLVLAALMASVGLSLAPAQAIESLASSTPDFSITVTPSSQTVFQGGHTQYQVQTKVTTGTPQPVKLSVSGLPAGATAQFHPLASIPAGGQAFLGVLVGKNVTPGSYPLTVTGTGPSATHSATATLV